MRTQRERFSQLAARVQRTAKPSSRRVEQLAVAASFDRSLKHQRVGSNNRHYRFDLAPVSALARPEWRVAALAHHANSGSHDR